MTEFQRPPATSQVIFPEYMSSAEKIEAIKMGQQKIYDFILSQPDFLTANWLQVLANAEKDFVKCIRVGYDSVITITNEMVVLRKYLPGGIPGFYHIRDADELREKGPSGVRYFTEITTFAGFKEVQPLAPDFEELATFGPSMMSREIAQQFCQWCQAVNSVGGEICFDVDRAYIRQDPNNIERSFNFKFNIKKPAYVSPADAIHAFKECMRYDYFYIVRKPDERRRMPIVLGRNWGHCVLLVTKEYY